MLLQTTSNNGFDESGFLFIYILFIIWRQVTKDNNQCNVRNLVRFVGGIFFSKKILPSTFIFLSFFVVMLFSLFGNNCLNFEQKNTSNNPFSNK
jgi:hypothetical protein